MCHLSNSTVYKVSLVSCVKVFMAQIWIKSELTECAKIKHKATGNHGAHPFNILQKHAQLVDQTGWKKGGIPKENRSLRMTNVMQG